MSVAFCTGGSGDIGSEIVRKLSLAGYDVAIGYFNNKENAQNIADEIISSGRKAIAICCDLSDSKAVQNSVQVVKSQLGDINVLVNNAGCANINLFTDLSDEEIIKIINTDLLGAMLITKSVLPDMIRQKSGNIVNISSVWGEVGASCEVAYSAAKAGIIGFTKALAKEVAPSGIRINCISPGLIDTKMNGELSNEDLQAVIDEIPMCRMGRPSEIADAVEFLISPKASYITGQTIRIDGAWI